MAAVALAKGSCLGAAIRTPAIPSASTSSRDAVFRGFSGLTLSDKVEQSVPTLRSTAAKGETVDLYVLVTCRAALLPCVHSLRAGLVMVTVLRIDPLHSLRQSAEITASLARRLPSNKPGRW